MYFCIAYGRRSYADNNWLRRNYTAGYWALPKAKDIQKPDPAKGGYLVRGQDEHKTVIAVSVGIVVIEESTDSEHQPRTYSYN